MTVETATNISQLNATYPAASDPKSEGDDHLRLIKSTLQATFPNVTGVETASATSNVATKVATTSQVQAAILAATGITAVLPGQGGNGGKFLQTDGTSANWNVVHGLQNFAASGTWTKPASVSVVMVELWAAGGGGGSGRRGAASTARYGGGGGGGGGKITRLFRASDLPATVTVTIGAGGAGAGGRTSNDTSGGSGTTGGNSTFGTLATAYGGVGGLGGTATDGSGGSGGGIAVATVTDGTTVSGGQGFGEFGAQARANATSLTDGYPSQDGGAAGGSHRLDAATITAGNGGISANGGPGGGAGGSIGNGDFLHIAAPGGGVSDQGLSTGGGGGALGGGQGGAGSAGASVTGKVSGTGGGGGSYGTTVNAGAGGAGGVAAGGGGGGASLNGFNSGAGGAGGNGYARITTFI